MHPTHPRYLTEFKYHHSYSSYSYDSYATLCAQWAPSGKHMVAGGESGSVIAHDHRGDEVWRTRSIYSKKPGARGRGGILYSHIQCLAYSPDGAYIAAGTFDHQVVLFDGVTGETKARWERRGHNTIIQHIAWSPDGKQVIATTSKGRLYHWGLDALSSGEKPGWTTGVEGALVGASFDASGEYIETFGADGILRSRAVAKYRKAYVLAEVPGKPRCVARCGEELLLGTSEGLFHFDHERRLERLNGGDIRSMCWVGQGGDHIAFRSRDCEVTLLSRDGHRFEEADRWEIDTSRSYRPFHLASSPDGAYLSIIRMGEGVYLCRTDDLGTDLVLESTPQADLTTRLRAFLAEQPPARGDSSSWYMGAPLDWKKAGKVCWQRELPRVQTQRFIADDKHVYLAAVSDSVGAIDILDGSVAWFGPRMRSTGGTVAQCPVGWLAGHRVVCLRSGMVAFDQDGDTIWRAFSDIPTERSRFPIASGEVIWNSLLHQRFAYHALEGHPLWTDVKPLHDSLGVAVSSEGMFIPAKGSQKMWLRHGEIEADWSVKNTVDRTPLWCGDDHIVASNYSDVLLLDRRDGATVWQKRMKSGVHSTYLFEDRVVLCLLNSRNVIALDASSGEYLWGIEASGEPKQNEKPVELTLAGEKVLIPQRKQLVVADILTGEVCFRQRFKEDITAPVVSAGDRLFVACGHLLHGIAAKKGRTPGRTPPPPLPPREVGPWRAREYTETSIVILALDATQVILGTDLGVTARSMSDGSVDWHIENGSTLVPSGGLFFDDLCIICFPVAYNIATLAALERSDGSVRWSIPLRGGYHPQILGQWGGAVLLNLGEDLLGVDVETGEERWRLEGVTSTHHPKVGATSDFVIAANKVTRVYDSALNELWSREDASTLRAWDDTLFITTSGSLVHAYELVSGELVWEHSCGDEGRARSVVLTSECVLFPTQTQVVCLAREDGALKWTRAHGAETYHGLERVGDRVCLALWGEPKLLYFDIETGDLEEVALLERPRAVKGIGAYTVLLQPSGEGECSKHSTSPLGPESDSPWNVARALTLSAAEQPEDALEEGAWRLDRPPVHTWVGLVGLFAHGGREKKTAGTLCLLDNGRVAVASIHMVVSVFDLKTGERVWRYDSGYGAVEVAMLGDVLVAWLRTNRLVGLDPNTGEERWVVDVPGQIKVFWSGVSQNETPERVLVITQDRHAWSIDASGAIVGHARFEQECTGRAEVDLHRGVIFIDAHAFELSTGKALWVAGEVEHVPDRAGLEDVFSSVVDFSHLHAFDRSSGARVWRISVDGSSKAFFAEQRLGHLGFALFASGYNGAKATVVCFDVRDGSEVWRVRTAQGGDAAPVLFGEVLLVSEDTGVLRALDARSGEEHWRCPLPEGIYSPAELMVHRDGFLVAGRNGLLVHYGWPE